MSEFLRILISPLLWLASFSAMYGLQGVLCGLGVEGTAFGGVPLARALLMTAYASAILGQGLLLAALYSRRYGSESAFVRFASRTTGWAGLTATVWTLLPVMTTSYCH